MIKLEKNSNDGSPSGNMTGSLADLIGDVSTLAELQFELFQVDTAEATRLVAKPTIFLVAALLLLIGSIPIAMLTAAAALHEFAGWSITTSLLTSALAGLLIGGITAWLSTSRITKAIGAFHRSTSELKNNVAWLKNLKRHRVPASKFEDRRQSTAL